MAIEIATTAPIIPKIIVMISSRPMLSVEDLPFLSEEFVDEEMVVFVADVEEGAGAFEGEVAAKDMLMNASSKKTSDYFPWRLVTTVVETKLRARDWLTASDMQESPFGCERTYPCHAQEENILTRWRRQRKTGTRLPRRSNSNQLRSNHYRTSLRSSRRNSLRSFNSRVSFSQTIIIVDTDSARNIHCYSTPSRAATTTNASR